MPTANDQLLETMREVQTTTGTIIDSLSGKEGSGQSSSHKDLELALLLSMLAKTTCSQLESQLKYTD